MQSWVQAPPVFAKFMNQKHPASMLTTKRAAGVTPEGVLRIIQVRSMQAKVPLSLKTPVGASSKTPKGANSNEIYRIQVVKTDPKALVTQYNCDLFIATDRLHEIECH